MLNDTPQEKTPALERREMRKMGRIGKIGVCLLVAGGMLPSASANAETEVFEINKEYLCLTENALFASTKLAQHGEWSDPPKRFQIHIKPCDSGCLPQMSKDRPLAMMVKQSGAEMAVKYDGYRGRPDYHSNQGGSIILSGEDLSVTRMMVGSMPGADKHVALVMAAQCHPID